MRIAAAMRRGFRSQERTRLLEDHEHDFRHALLALCLPEEIAVAASWLCDQHFALLTSDRILWCEGGSIHSLFLSETGAVWSQPGDVVAVTTLDEEYRELLVAPSPASLPPCSADSTLSTGSMISRKTTRRRSRGGT